MNEPLDHTSIPPGKRTTLGQQFSAANSDEQTLVLQVCDACQTVQYPSREVCKKCLGDSLCWQPVDGSGTVMVGVELHHSLHAFFKQRLPWVIGSVELDCGPQLVVHMTRDLLSCGARVKVFACPDSSGAAVLVAVDDAASQQQRVAAMRSLQLLNDRSST